MENWIFGAQIKLLSSSLKTTRMMMQRQRMAFPSSLCPMLPQVPVLDGADLMTWHWPQEPAWPVGAQCIQSLSEEWGRDSGVWKSRRLRAAASIPIGCQRPFCQVQVFEPDASTFWLFLSPPSSPTFDPQRNPHWLNSEIWTQAFYSPGPDPTISHLNYPVVTSLISLFYLCPQ